MAFAARWWRRLALRRPRIVAVTGSFGKTTTTRALHAAFGLPLHRYIDLNIGLAIPRAILRIPPWRKRAALELGMMRPGQLIHQIRATQPDIGVVTWIGREHISSFGSEDRIAEEKSQLIRALPPTGLAVLNIDDPRVAAMAALARCRVVTYGLGPQADFRGENVGFQWPDGMRFDLVWRGVRRPMFIPMLGKPGVYAALAAAAAALSEGQDMDEVVSRLAHAKAKEGRLYPVILPNGARLLRDEFKGLIESFDMALDTFAQMPASRRIVLFGEFDEGSGRQPREIMRRLGRRVAGMADVFIFSGSRDAGKVFRSGARSAGMAEENIHLIHRSAAECVALLREMLRPGDALLIKGRHSERLDRVSLALMGREVRCTIPRCHLVYVRCDFCSKLERGWDNPPQAESGARRDDDARNPGAAPDA